MAKNLYIDASHPNETRVVLKSTENIEDYEYESVNNTLIKNNIYLGKVSRIEPSLQAAFVDFGRERHGFLSFNDIQSDYYQLPKDDLEKIKVANINDSHNDPTKVCPVCNGTGYKGRIGLYEVLKINDSIRELIMKSSTADVIRDASVKNGLKTLLDYGMELVKDQLTTIEEVERVCILEDSGDDL